MEDRRVTKDERSERVNEERGADPPAAGGSVCKVGGSLRDAGLAVAAAEAARRGSDREPLLLLSGGGELADRVRERYRRGHIGEEEGHWLAVRALDVTTTALARALEPPLPVARSADEIGATLRDAGAAAVPPHEILRAEDPLPHSWAVTSDSIAAWLAHRFGAGRLVLLKARSAWPGRPGRGPGERSVEAASSEGLVDRHLSEILRSTDLECRVLEGREPDRVRRLFAGAGDPGTRLRPAAR